MTTLKKTSLLLLIALAICTPLKAAHHDFTVLVFSKTEGFRHSSIDEGIAAIQQLGVDHHFTVVASEDATLFTYENLMQYDAVIFLSTTGDILNADQQAAFEAYINSGGGFVGIHAASDTEYDWPWYGGLIGAYFESHPPGTPTATIKVADKVHPSTSFLPEYWVRTDEWYNFQENPRGNVHVLMTLDESTYDGGNMGVDHPIAWLHQYEGGRAWYTGGGHTEASFSEPEFLEHILGGIHYAVGEITGDYEGTVDNKYIVTIIDNNPQDPMELAVLPNQDVLYVERGGALKRIVRETGLVETVANFNVDSGREDGLLGIVLDPDYETNSWIYLFYSPSSVVEQRVSRFEYADGDIDLESEEILLQIPLQREQCCHSGGDLEFDGNGNLYISTGDNTNPFDSDGYAPIDERAGREPWDAQRTSGNTNDLRGKILRIHPEDDGTFSIPEGNLFTDIEDGLPEIFVMGTRNPFRIAVNKETNELVWGDVGPDAGGDSGTRGPRGYDEFNRTSVSGNFGWPFCIGDNYAYQNWNFATNSSEGLFNCAATTNDSPNNTGATTLPPAIPAWLYYPYGPSEERPEFGSEGSRTAIGGDFFNFDASDTETGGFPEYFDGTLFIAEWTRNWIKEVRTDTAGNVLQINPFLESLSLNRPIDLHFGPDGAMYLIEWGTGFGGGNADARILRIEYSDNLGNRPPQAIATASVQSGSLPLEVEFFGDRSTDPDYDFLTYSWDFDGDGTEDATTQNATYTYTVAGTYIAKLTVTDPEGETSVAQVQVTAGNSEPVVSIDYPANGGFYEAGDVIEFKVSVTDADEGSIGQGIDCDDIVTEPSIGHDDHAHGVGESNGCEGSFVTQSHGNGPDNVFYVFNAEYTDDGGPVGVSLTGKAGIVLNRKIKQAQHAFELIDAQAETTGDFLGGGQNIGYINDFSAIVFKDMNFENIDYITLRYATQSIPATVEVRLGGISGSEIARIYTDVTGAWQSYDYFTTKLENPGGLHDVYLVFKNSGQSGIGNVNWVEFHGKGVAKENPDSLKGLAASYFPNTDFSGTPVVRREPMIAWDWSRGAPNDDTPSNGFSARWEGEVIAPTSGQYTLSLASENGTANLWIDDVQVITAPATSTSLAFTGGEAKKIKVEYVHTTGTASVYLRWAGSNPSNVIHEDFLRADQDVLDLSSESITEAPTEIKLLQNYPNPFNPSTIISYQLPIDGHVNLKVFDVLGREVAALINGRKTAGHHSVTFDASGLSSGLYFYKIEFGGNVISRKMMLLK